MTRFEQVITIIGERNPLQAKSIAKTLPTLTAPELAEADRTLNFFSEKMNYTTAEIADAYLWLMDMMMEEQMKFMRSGK
jgi:hypothetical protein